MHAVRTVAATTVLLVSSLVAAPVHAEPASLPAGTSMSVEIASPAPGTIFPPGAVQVQGTAAVGDAPAVKNATVLYVVDVSGSTTDSAGVDCDGVAGNDSILACEKAAVRAVNAQAVGARSPVANSGIVAFNSTATALDLMPFLTGTQPLVPPGPNIDSGVNSLAASGNTNYFAAMNTANSVLRRPAAKPVKTVVFLSDGRNNGTGTFPALPSGTTVRAFALGSATCTTGLPSLATVAALGGPGSGCTQVTDLSVLDDVIVEQVGSSLDALPISVDGGPAVPIPNADIDPDLPRNGPASVSYSTTVTIPTAGPHEICVTANGSDGGGSGSASDCVDIEVVDTVVECTGTCTATASDGEVANAVFVGQNLDKQVGIRAGESAPGECGGADCVTGFDVLFEGEDDGGRAYLFTVVNPPFATPFRNAKVYFDGVEITRSCISNLLSRPEQLPCKIVGPWFNGGTAYFVKFAADPRIRYR
jgi:hypothetical protein